MAKLLSRAAFENFYADEIVSRGNPHYFVFKVIRDWEDWELEEAMEELYKESENNDEAPRILDEE
jgi:hypothetical protein